MRKSKYSTMATALHKHKLKKLNNQSLKIKKNIWYQSAKYGRLTFIKKLVENNIEGYSPFIMDIAAHSGHLNIVKYLHNNYKDCTENAMDYAAYNGHIHVLDWLNENRTEGCTKNAMNYAIINGQFGAVWWLYFNTNNYSLSEAKLNALKLNENRILRLLQNFGR